VLGLSGISFIGTNVFLVLVSDVRFVVLRVSYGDLSIFVVK
jgi:hypothetical protein